MKIAVLGDVHLIADSDPYKHLHDKRLFFKSAWPSFTRLLSSVNREGPDLVILLGDLVDWFSPQNIAFGLDLLTDLKCPWQMIPGNHDLAAPSEGPEQQAYQTTATRDHLAYWAGQGVDLRNRTIEMGGYTSILLDSSLSDLAEGADDWLARVAEHEKPKLLFSHVPVDLAVTREYILSVDPRRSMVKYVISAEPGLYEKYIAGRIEHVFSGHLHFSGDLSFENTRFHLCTMGISMSDPHRSYSTVATAKIVEIKRDGLAFRDIMVE